MLRGIGMVAELRVAQADHQLEPRGVRIGRVLDGTAREAREGRERRLIVLRGGASYISSSPAVQYEIAISSESGAAPVGGGVTAPASALTIGVGATCGVIV